VLKMYCNCITFRHATTGYEKRNSPLLKEVFFDQLQRAGKFNPVERLVKTTMIFLCIEIVIILSVLIIAGPFCEIWSIKEKVSLISQSHPPPLAQSNY